jgi:hypothetical protein
MNMSGLAPGDREVAVLVEVLSDRKILEVAKAVLFSV